MSIDDLRAVWRSELRSTHAWRVHPDRQATPGEAGGVLLICDDAPFGGYMKPTAVKGADEFLAASEKIVGDIAFDLGLSVPGVLLYDKPPTIPGAEGRCCISLVMHPRNHEWGEIWPLIEAQTVTGSIIRGSLAQLSGIVAFDTWIGNTDRNNTRNVVYGDDPDATLRNRFVAIDHACALNRGGCWSGGRWSTMQRAPFPGNATIALDKRQISDIVGRIESLPDSAVESVVTRIPDNYMDPAHKSVVVEGLNGRKRMLRAFLLHNP